MKFKYILILGIIILVGYFGFKFTIKNYIYPCKYTEYVNKYSDEYDLDPYFVLSVIKAESNFDKDAVSGKDAKGLMQIMDETGIWAAKKIGIDDFTVESLFDVETNIRIGCWYLKTLEKEFKDQDLVIAAYNGGSGNVNSWLKDTRYSKDGKSLSYIPFAETKKYVDKVNVNYKAYKKLYEK